jgi:hypothetical protein
MTGYLQPGANQGQIDRLLESEEDILDREREIYEESEQARNEGLDEPAPIVWDEILKEG